ncbi:hypothetical protein BU23DRAFT_569065 [Bimuria novae-zelandiae CBS 107.79]|uniref:Uncharacterized protein n=1 Tax=Bimuria novae-zelandiae CBS 107.79 TaxID=1447943 RepID=A0A6A5V783_9PLEO|nr:hypothetical protein BU23DRAFT_569065 [Bimuria novae-zelandiae CBS 107.79]
MGFSSFFNNATDTHPTVSALMLNPNEVEVEEVRTLISYVDLVVRVRNQFTIAPCESFIDTVNLYRHNLLFGMEAYAEQLSTSAYNHINKPDTILPAAELEAVIKLPRNNHLYEGAMCRFEGLSFAGKMPESGGVRNVPCREREI